MMAFHPGDVEHWAKVHGYGLCQRDTRNNENVIAFERIDDDGERCLLRVW